MKKIFLTVSALMVSLVVVVGMCSFTSHTEVQGEVCTDVSCQGKRCNGSVGCSCPGFSPVQHKEVWKQAYCRYCGHHRGLHK